MFALSSLSFEDAGTDLASFEYVTSECIAKYATLQDLRILVSKLE